MFNGSPPPRLALSVSLLTLIAATPALAQTEEPEAHASAETIVVTGTKSRIPLDLESVPGSVTVLQAADIATQSKFGNDLGEILQRTVPGFGLSSSASYSNFSQTLRGRKPAVFIDGVPTTTPLRDGGRDLRLISPAAIGRVEVIRGATALYGLGGAGGLINYATKEPVSDGLEFQTDIAAGLSFTNPDDSLNWSLDQTVTGRSGSIGYIFSGYYEQYNSLFDASGDRIPPNPQNQGGIADTDAYNLYGKVIIDLTPTQKIAVSGNYYRVEQDSEFSNQPGVGVFGSVPTPAQRVRAPGENEFTKNWLAIGRYDNEDILGSAFSLQGYFGKYSARFPFFSFPNFPPLGGQSLISAERWGVRADFVTPLTLFGADDNILWGIDYSHDQTSQPIERPGVPTALFVPEMKQASIAPFAQFTASVADWLTLRGGLRWENADVKVDTFTTIPLFSPTLMGGVTIQGGTLKYEEILFNIGAVLSPFKGGALDGVSVYAGFSQGFSVGDLGRALRSTTAPSIEQFGFKAQIIDSYEAGIRADYDTVDASLAVFLSKSEFGSTFNAVTLELTRAPEKVWGIEGTIDVKPTDGWAMGANVSWVDGNQKNVVTGIVSPLDTSRISPVKAVFYASYDFAESWTSRLQLTYSGRQNRFPGNPTVFGRADIEAFALLDFSIGGQVGPGRMTFAVNNLLNEKYFTPDAYRFANANQFTTGQGVTGRISYSLRY